MSRLGGLSHVAEAEMVEATIETLKEPFTISDLERARPGVRRDIVRRVLHRLKEVGKLSL